MKEPLIITELSLSKQCLQMCFILLFPHYFSSYASAPLHTLGVVVPEPTGDVERKSSTGLK